MKFIGFLLLLLCCQGVVNAQEQQPRTVTTGQK